MSLHSEHGSNAPLAVLTGKSPLVALGIERVPAACVRRDAAWP